MTIFSFTDYKSYIHQRIKQMPRRGRGEVLRLAKALSVHSTLISQILSGPRDFTLEQGYAVCKHFGLVRIEADYFILMIQVERAGTMELKKYFREKLEALKKDSLELSKQVVRDRELNEEEKAHFYSDWVYSGVRLLTAVPEHNSLDRIAATLDLPLAMVNDILKFLTQTGLLVEKNGSYEIGVQRTYLEQDSPIIKNHHRNWRVKSLQRSSTLTNEELMFTCPVALSEKDFHALRSECAEFVKQFLNTVKDSPSERLACLNLDWFFITK